MNNLINILAATVSVVRLDTSVTLSRPRQSPNQTWFVFTQNLYSFPHSLCTFKSSWLHQFTVCCDFHVQNSPGSLSQISSTGSCYFSTSGWLMVMFFLTVTSYLKVLTWGFWGHFLDYSKVPFCVLMAVVCVIFIWMDDSEVDIKQPLRDLWQEFMWGEAEEKKTEFLTCVLLRFLTSLPIHAPEKSCS